MPTTAKPTWDGLTSAERTRVRLDNADALDRCRRADGCSFDPVRAAAYERREAAAELAGSPEAGAIALGHGAAN